MRRDFSKEGLLLVGFAFDDFEEGVDVLQGKGGGEIRGVGFRR